MFVGSVHTTWNLCNFLNALCTPPDASLIKHVWRVTLKMIFSIPSFLGCLFGQEPAASLFSPPSPPVAAGPTTTTLQVPSYYPVAVWQEGFQDDCPAPRWLFGLCSMNRPGPYLGCRRCTAPHENSRNTFVPAKPCKWPHFVLFSFKLRFTARRRGIERRSSGKGINRRRSTRHLCLRKAPLRSPPTLCSLEVPALSLSAGVNRWPFAHQSRWLTASAMHHFDWCLLL